MSLDKNGEISTKEGGRMQNRNQKNESGFRERFIFVFVFLFVVFGIHFILSDTKVEYDDSILGSEYIASEMPVPTATPTPAPTLPPDFVPVQANYDTELVSIYNQPGKNVYLTFDDGPTANITPQVLDILKEKDVKATFFVLGVNVVKNPELAKRIAAEGHAICNHSYSHDYKMLYNGTDHFKSDLLRAEETILSTVGEEAFVKVFRFPGGSFEKRKNSQKAALQDIGYKFLDWNSLNGDAEGLNVPAGTLVENVKKTIRNRRVPIILMHDSATKQTTADSLGEIIDYLKSEGFEFKTLKDIPLE